MTAPDVNADVRARFAVTDEDVEASGAAYFDGQWDDLPPRSKAIYRNAIRRALTVYAKRQAAHADLSGEVREWRSIETPPAVASTASHPVLVYVPEFGVRMGWYTKAYADKGEWPWSADGFCGLTNQTITYWMPRPEPPAALPNANGKEG